MQSNLQKIIESVKEAREIGDELYTDALRASPPRNLTRAERVILVEELDNGSILFVEEEAEMKPGAWKSAVDTPKRKLFSDAEHVQTIHYPVFAANSLPHFKQ